MDRHSPLPAWGDPGAPDADDSPHPDARHEPVADAIEALWHAHGAAIERLLRRRVDHEEDASELTQEAFLRVLRYRHLEPESLTRLLYRVAVNLAVSHRRQARHRFEAEWEPHLDMACERPSPEVRVDQAQSLSVAIGRLSALPPRCRQVFALSRLHGLRNREVASACSISTGMVERHLARARALIRSR